MTPIIACISISERLRNNTAKELFSINGATKQIILRKQN